MMTTDSATAPVRWTPRWALWAVSARAWLAAAASKLDGFDIACTIALTMMLAGLTIWIGIGPALTITGGLLFVLVVYPEWLAHKAKYAAEVRRSPRGD